MNIDSITIEHAAFGVLCLLIAYKLGVLGVLLRVFRAKALPMPGAAPGSPSDRGTLIQSLISSLLTHLEADRIDTEKAAKTKDIVEAVRSTIEKSPPSSPK